jgi:hypothetical protein
MGAAPAPRDEGHEPRPGAERRWRYTIAEGDADTIMEAQPK